MSRPEVSVSPIRAKIEHASFPVLQALSRVPQLVLAGIALVLVILGGVFGGVLGALLILIVAVFVGWTTYLTWPGLDRSVRLMRGATFFLLIALAMVDGLSHALLF
ncbi:hypothetical protein GCM10027579_05140 [Calidifontibacter terrae]